MSTLDQPVDGDELRVRVAEYRRERGMSLRAAAEESGVPFNTLSRVEKGHLPDLANFTRLLHWVGLDPAEVFKSPQRLRPESTPEAIKSSLHSDPNLSEQAANQISDLVNKLYQALATPLADTRMHLRVLPTFTPRAATKLSSILEDMQAILLADDSLGEDVGWEG